VQALVDADLAADVSAYLAHLASLAALARSHVARQRAQVMVRDLAPRQTTLLVPPAAQGAQLCMWLAPLGSDPTLAGEATDLAACQAAWRAYESSGAADKLFLALVVRDSRETAISALQAEHEATIARRESWGYGRAATQARAGYRLRQAIGYCYDPNTEAGQSAPTERAPHARPERTDGQTIRREAGSYSAARMDRRAVTLAPCSDDACRDAVHDPTRQVALASQRRTSSQRRSARRAEQRIALLKTRR
jgi:hypothetical protein